MRKKLVLSLLVLGGELLFAMTEVPRYYVMFGAYETATPTGRRRIDAIKSHTFALFSEVTDGEATSFTLSWGPCEGDLIVKVVPKVFMQKGCNFNWRRTVERPRERGIQVWRWEPMEIQRALYVSARETWRSLRQYDEWAADPAVPSRWEYAVIDRVERKRGLAKHCSHMVADVVAPFRGHLRTFDLFGVPATKMVIDWLRPWILRMKVNEPELEMRLLEGEGRMERG